MNDEEVTKEIVESVFEIIDINHCGKI